MHISKAQMIRQSIDCVNGCSKTEMDWRRFVFFTFWGAARDDGVFVTSYLNQCSEEILPK